MKNVMKTNIDTRTACAVSNGTQENKMPLTSLFALKEIRATTALVALSLLTLFATACSDNKQAAEAAKAIAEPAQAEVDGSSSGGGSFGDESSLVLLNQAVDELTLNLKYINPSAIPSELKKDKLIALLNNLKLEPNDSSSRYDRELMFDYDSTKGQEKIKVKSLFFKSHAAIPVNSLGASRVAIYVEEIKLKLLHEAAHIFGIGTTENTDAAAREVAASLMEKFKTNNLFCHIQEEGGFKFPYESSFTRSDAVLAGTLPFALNRPSGEGGILERGGPDEESATMIAYASRYTPEQIQKFLETRGVKSFDDFKILSTSFTQNEQRRVDYQQPYPSRNGNKPIAYMAYDWVPGEVKSDLLRFTFHGNVHLFLPENDNYRAYKYQTLETLVLRKGKDRYWQGSMNIIMTAPKDSIGKSLAFKVFCYETL